MPSLQRTYDYVAAGGIALAARELGEWLITKGITAPVAGIVWGIEILVLLDGEYNKSQRQ